MNSEQEYNDSSYEEQPYNYDTEQSSNDSELSNNYADEIELNDGSKVTIDELKNGYMRQSDYTRKTQEIAKNRQSDNQNNDETDDETLRAIELLKSKGFVTMDSLKQIETEKESFSNFKNSMTGTLNEKQIEAVYKIKSTLGDNKTFEDIAKDYGFIDDAILERAKGSRMIPGNGLRRSEPTREELIGPPPKWLK